MSQIEVERFLGRIITDADFRTGAANSLNNTCYREGFALSAEEISLLRYLDFSRFGTIAESLDDSLRRT
ncbi:MAG: hypothetical protein HXX11_03990 [Desulfuromonadales bacterium]|nr:hypothetical protein [Desulfuromonadales bacterium]